MELKDLIRKIEREHPLKGIEKYTPEVGQRLFNVSKETAEKVWSGYLKMT